MLKPGSVDERGVEKDNGKEVNAIRIQGPWILHYIYAYTHTNIYTHLRILTNFSRGTEMRSSCLARGGDNENTWPKLAMMIARTFLSRRADCTWQPSAEHKWPTLVSFPNVSLQESSARHNSLAHVITNNTCVKKRWKVNIVMSQPFISTREKVKVKDLMLSAGFLEASSWIHLPFRASR